MSLVILLTCAPDPPSPPASAPVAYTRGRMTDPRDGKTYPTVTIGRRTWMAANLDYGVCLVSRKRKRHHRQMYRDRVNAKYCYFNKTVSCSAFGALYEWHEAMAWDTTEGAQGLCPPGWHIPSDAEWRELERTLGMDSAAVMKTGCRGTDQGISLCDTAGFNFKMTGIRNLYGGFTMQGSYGTPWTSTKAGKNAAWYRGVLSGKGTIRRDTCSTWFGKCVRCIKDK